MEVKITFKVSVVIEGSSIKEITDKWQNTQMLSADALHDLHATYEEVCEAIDTETDEKVTLDY